MLHITLIRIFFCWFSNEKNWQKMRGFSLNHEQNDVIYTIISFLKIHFHKSKGNGREIKGIHKKVKLRRIWDTEVCDETEKNKKTNSFSLFFSNCSLLIFPSFSIIFVFVSLFFIIIPNISIQIHYLLLILPNFRFLFQDEVVFRIEWEKKEGEFLIAWVKMSVFIPLIPPFFRQ